MQESSEIKYVWLIQWREKHEEKNTVRAKGNNITKHQCYFYTKIKAVLYKLNSANYYHEDLLLTTMASSGASSNYID